MPDLDTPITTTEQLQDHLDKAASAARKDQERRTRQEFADYDDLKQFKADAEETLNKAVAQLDAVRADRDSAIQERDQAKADAEAKGVDALRAQVAAEKGVPVRWISGDSKEDMEKAAADWLADARAKAKPGVLPRQGDGDPVVSTYDLGAERAKARFGRKSD